MNASRRQSQTWRSATGTRLRTAERRAARTGTTCTVVSPAGGYCPGTMERERLPAGPAADEGITGGRNTTRIAAVPAGMVPW